MGKSAGAGNLVKIIDRYRELEQISDAEVARRIGVSRQNVYAWRSRGVTTLPSRATLQAIAAGVHAPYAEVLTAALADTGHVDEFGTDDDSQAPDVSGAPLQMGDFAASRAARNHSAPVSLCQPMVVYEADSSGSQDVTRWRAYLQLTDADAPDIKVIGGFAKFTLIRIPATVDLDEHLLPSPYAALFEGGELEPYLDEEVSSESTFQVILLDGIFVDPSLRGHRLGAWLVSDYVKRMSHSVNGLLAIHPPTAVNQIPAATDRLARYLRNHLHLQGEYRGFLLQHTAYTSVDDAAAELHDVPGEFITINDDALRTRWCHHDSDLWPITDLLDGKPVPQSVGPDEALAAVDRRNLAAFMRIMKSVDEDDCASVRICTQVRFTATPSLGISESDLFYRAAEYLEQNPELAVESVIWRDLLNAHDEPGCALDIEVVPVEYPKPEAFSPQRVGALLNYYPWVVWEITMIDPGRGAGDDVAERTAQAAAESATRLGCMYEYCNDEDTLADGTKYFSWILGVPQAAHRERREDDVPVAVNKFMEALQLVLPGDKTARQQWIASVALWPTYVRNEVDQGY